MRKKNFHPLQRLCVVKRRSMRHLAFALLLPATPLFAQRVNISMNNAPLERVCKELEKQTGYYFVYPQNMRDSGPQVSVQLKDADVNTALQRVFESTPYHYEVTDKVVSVNTAPAVKTPLVAFSGPGKDTLVITLKGILLGNVGSVPLANASVSTSYTHKTTLTNLKGEFELKGVKLGEEVIVSYIGYEKARKVIADTSMYILMKPAENQLDKVVVKAYGVTSKRLNTGNIASISGKELEGIPTQNPLLALVGRVPGLEISQTGASPSSPMRVTVRGRNSLNNLISSDPLFVIDGVPQTVLDLSAKQTGLSNQVITSNGLDQGLGLGLNVMFGLNANDIESIEVLKDAGATAIYGSRGANGVILITTKKIKGGRTRFSVNAQEGITSAVKYQDLLNTKDYLAMRRQAYAAAGFTPNNVVGSAGYAPEFFAADTTRDINWQHYMFGHTGLYTSISPQLTGGSDYAGYMLSASFTNQTDIKPSNSKDQSASVLMKVNANSPDNKLVSSFSVLYMNTKNTALGAIANSGLQAPVMPDPYDSLGNLNYAAYKKMGNAYFPFGGLKQYVALSTNRINASFNIGYTLLPGLELSTEVGYNFSVSNGDRVDPVVSKAAKEISGTPAVGDHNVSNTQINNLIVEPKARWNKSVGDGVLTVLLGATYQGNTTRTSLITGAGYKNDDLINSIEAAPSTSISASSGQYKYAGAFTGIDYVLANKYILNLTGRRDGSSRFGPGKQFGDFWSAGAGWILSEEPWVQKALPKAVTFLKLRSSYGTTGGDGVGDYQYLAQWAYQRASNTAHITPVYNGVNPIMVSLAANDQFHWQTNKKLEIGLETGFFNNLSVVVDWYRNRCDDQLLGYPLPSFTGFSSITANSVANVQNSGWDLVVSATPVRTPNVNWSVTGNVNIQRNKLISYPGLDLSPYATVYHVGQSLSATPLYHYLGTGADGKFQYLDRNHDGIISYNSSVIPGTGTDDRVVYINTDSKYSAGFSTNFRYKGWSINPAFSFRRVALPVNYPDGRSISDISYWQWQHSWTPQNPGALMPAITADPLGDEQAKFSMSDRKYAMTNILRMNSFRLIWTSQSEKLVRHKISLLSFNVSANNLLLITNYKAGIDPELPISDPSVRTVTVGCNVSF